MNNKFDVLIIGSGFGGSVMAHRLTEKGLKIALLERGSEYPMFSFPRRVHEVKENLFWDPKDSKYGIMEIRDDAGSDFLSITGSGLGGGSLIYANVLLRLEEEYFSDWPFKLTAQRLEPYYKKVLDIMDASPYPLQDKDYTDTPKTNIYRESFSKIKQTEDMLEPAKLIAPDLAINFKGSFPGEQVINKHGKLQSKCNSCGECDIGCNIHAKNTLDHNYIHLARKNGASVFTEQEVIDIQRLPDDSFEIKAMNPRTKEESLYYANKVVFSAGAIGTPRLLQKLQAKGRLPNISSMLGKKICGNGDFLAYSNFTNKKFLPTKGPVITTAVQYKMKPYPDNYKHSLYLEDAGAPIGLAWYLAAKIPQPQMLGEYFKFLFFFIFRKIGELLNLNQSNAEINIGDDFANALDKDKFIQNMFVHLAMGRDRNTGVMIFEGEDSRVHWDLKESALHFKRAKEKIKEFTELWGGDYMPNPFMSINKIFAVHPLGGCIIGESPAEGVVNLKGQIYGEKNLYIADGSIIPESLGPNPSLTIAAMAEMIAETWD